MMTGDRPTYRKRDGRERDDNSVSDLAARDVAHQSLREEKSVERATDDADYFSDSAIERRIIRVSETSNKDVSVQQHNHDDRDDRRDLGQQSVADGAEPAIAPRRILR